MSFLKFLSFLIFVVLIGYSGYKSYTFFFSEGTPQLTVDGINSEQTYAGDVPITIKGHDDYKVARLSVLVDDTPLLDAVKIGKSTFEYPFTLQTAPLAQGKHTIAVEIVNGTRFHKKNSTKFDFYVDNEPLHAALIKNEADAKVFQGRTLHLVYQTNKELKHGEVKAFSKTFPCFAQAPGKLLYECFIPIETEESPQQYQAQATLTDKAGTAVTVSNTFEVMSFPFKKQSIKIAPDKIKHENDSGLSEKQFESDIEELTTKSPKQKLWNGTFITPIEINDPKQITTEFGVTRTTQERGLRQHKALDVYTTPKSVVWAPQDGIIALKNRYAHSGNTVVIDHGWGILTLLFHLDSFAPMEVGDKIKKGNPVGTLGKTGYATGYHLHWEFRVNNVAVEPLEWTKAHF